MGFHSRFGSHWCFNHKFFDKMRTFLVCALVAFVSADEEAAPAAAAVLPLPYHHLGYGGYPFYGHGLVHQPVQYKHVVKEVPIEVQKFVPEVVTTGCVNSFGTAVPCSIDGEARKRRSADEAPAATVALAHPYAYAGYAHPAYAYPGYAYPYVAPKVLEPKTVEIEVPTPVLKEVEVKVPVGPACQNHLGFPVPCL